jgi:predicted RNase H-like HicB family nuclease
MTKRTIVFEITKIDGHNFYVARSSDLRGVYAQGDTVEQVRRRLPRIIRAYFEAQGLHVDTVRTSPAEQAEDGKNKSRFVKAEARLEAA